MEHQSKNSRNHNNLNRLNAILETRRQGLAIASIPDTMGFRFPGIFTELLVHSNGFVTRNRIFRIFGTVGDDEIPSIQTVNDSEWKFAFDEWLHETLLIADDIFGNLYGFNISDPNDFVRFDLEYCKLVAFEGGLAQFLEELLKNETSELVDSRLLRFAILEGMIPKPSEHLAFALPLVAGGERSEKNLEVETADLHFSVISQIANQIKSTKDGTKISRFKQDSDH